MITDIKIIKKDYKDNYKYNVQIWHDNTYCGHGKFCKTYEDIKEYIKRELGD